MVFGQKGTSKDRDTVNFSKNLALWIIIGLLLVLALFNLCSKGRPSAPGVNELAFSEFVIASVDAGRRQGASPSRATRYLAKTSRGGGHFQTYAPNDPQLVERLKTQEGVQHPRGAIRRRLADPLGCADLVVPDAAADRRVDFLHATNASGGGGAMGFGKSKAKLLTEKQGRVTFEDVAGIDEAKTELEEIVEFLRDPQKFQRLGGKIPKGCLLSGRRVPVKRCWREPLLAKRTSRSSQSPVRISLRCSSASVPARVRDMFEQGKKNAPCIIFIDEIDAVGRHRGAGLGGGNDEREQTLNQLLVEMDGFEANEGVILIAATNRPDVLDPALLRPGRFDRQVVVPNPDISGARKSSPCICVKCPWPRCRCRDDCARHAGLLWR